MYAHYNDKETIFKTNFTSEKKKIFIKKNVIDYVIKIYARCTCPTFIMHSVWQLNVTYSYPAERYLPPYLPKYSMRLSLLYWRVYSAD